MTTVFLAPAPVNTTQFIPGGNTPAAGAQLFSYITGSSTKQNIYTTSSGTVAYSNPLVLDSGGNIPGSKEIWIPQGLPARFVLAPSTDTDPPLSPYWTIDNISGINDVTFPTNQEWISSGLTPTFAGAASFVVNGDQTSIFTLGRRVKTTNSGGTVYGTVSSAAFGTSTSVGLYVDSSALDGGLSAVSYGILSTPNGSVPWTQIRSTGLDFSNGAVTTGTFIANTVSANSISTVTMTGTGSSVWGSGIANFGMVVQTISNPAIAITSTTFLSFSTLSFPIPSNSVWCGNYQGLFFKSSGGDSGVKINVLSPSGATSAVSAWAVSINNTTNAKTSSTGTIDFPVGAFGGVNLMMNVEATVINSSNSGFITFQAAKSSNTVFALSLENLGAFSQFIRLS